MSFKNKISAFKNPIFFLQFFCLAGLFGFIFLHQTLTVQEHEKFRQLIPKVTTTTPTPPAPPSSSIDLPFFSDNDSYLWILNTEQAIRQRHFHIRVTNIDNAPYGRPVHWSSLPAWWIAGIAAVCHDSQANLADCIPYAAQWSNPLLLFLVMGGILFIITRACGLWPAILTTATFSTLGYTLFAYSADNADHHGWQLTVSLLGVLTFILAHRIDTHRKGWITASGILFGMGLALGLPGQTLILCSLGIGILTAQVFQAFGEKPVQTNFSYLRLWGWTGAASSILFYVVEYFPSGLLSIRLEVNHPVYALAFGGGGELLYRIGTALAHRSMPRKKELPALFAFTSFFLLPLGLILFGSKAWFTLSDPTMVRFHRNILEFLPLSEYLALPKQGNPWILWGALPIVFFLSIITARLLLKRKDPSALPLLILLPSFFLLCLAGIFQFRWLNLAAIIGVVLTLQLFLCLMRVRNNFLTRTFFAVLFLQFTLIPIYWSRYHRSILTQTHVPPETYEYFAYRSLGDILKAFTPEAQNILTSDAGAPSIAYFSGIHCVSSFYWENYEGLQTMLRFFNATNDLEAQTIARERKLNFVYIHDDAWPANAYRIQYGTVDQVAVSKTLAYRMLHEPESLPPWLIPLTSLTYRFPYGFSSTIRLFEISSP